MKCIDCKTKNINDANYCINCCHNFTEKEKKDAHNKTFIGILEKIEKGYNICSLKVITDHIIFKIVSILIILGIGIYSVINNGSELKIEKNPNYEISYNEELKEYYLKVQEQETTLDFYLPNKVNKIIIKHWSKDNKLLEENEYSKQDEIKLSTNINEDYYTVEASYSDTNSDRIKIYLYEEK